MTFRKVLSVNSNSVARVLNDCHSKDAFIGREGIYVGVSIYCWGLFAYFFKTGRFSVYGVA